METFSEDEVLFLMEATRLNQKLVDDILSLIERTLLEELPKHSHEGQIVFLQEFFKGLRSIKSG